MFTTPRSPRSRRGRVAGLALSGALVLGMAAAPPITAAPSAGSTEEQASRFRTSYEEGDPALDWVGETEIRPDGTPWSKGVSTSSVPGDLTSRVVAATASAENTPNETAAKLADGSPSSKWLAFASTAWVQLELDEPTVVVDYVLTSANDAPERDPQDWTLQGSTDGETWTTLDTRSGETFADRLTANSYETDNENAYSFYRLDITANVSGGLLQLGELTLSDGSDEMPAGMEVVPGGGPGAAYASKTGVGFTGVRALQYSGRTTNDDGGHHWQKLHDVDLPVGPDTELSYRIFPEFTGDLAYQSTYAAVDVAFTDGTYLSELEAEDQYRFGASPAGQGDSKALFTNQWNHRAVRLGDVAAGKTIDRLLIGYDAPVGPKSFSGWIDDIAIADRQIETHERPSDWVDTRRGTHSTGAYSRGNNLPATVVPHGFNFWIPVTDAGVLNWPYAYHQDNDDQNRPRLEAFAASHAPSPWMGDRQTFQFMPSIAEGAPETGRDARAMTFSHDNEKATAHHYRVEFDNGTVTEMAPTDHAAIVRFEFPGDDASVIFDNVNGNSGLTIHDDGTVTGYSDVRSGLSAGATRLFVHAEFDQEVVEQGTEDGNTGWVRLAPEADGTATMRIATSLISVDQARKNLQLEIGADDTFDSVRDRAQAAWDQKLSIIEVEGATPNELTTLYSNLYRLNAYPNSGFENTGTVEEPRLQYASPVSELVGENTATSTGAEIVDGKIYVNNGFWDTYRTAWPAYSLLAPDDASELVDGFVQQYRDGGWISRWSSPGYANLMTGTSSDAAFADAYTKGVDLPDPMGTYRAGLKNATVTPPGSATDSDVGRKGLSTSIFRGWTDTSVGEGTSWGLEGGINDFALARQADKLAEDPSLTDAEVERLTTEATYLDSRSMNYVNHFDPAVGFFQGRQDDGSFRYGPDDYDPRVWGQHDYTETNGWNFAYHVPFDGQGLANLYGGREGLGAKLDEFFSTPETARFPGTYGGTIHEMVEARDVRMGMWGFSNQVSHHIPFMYIHAGEPWKTQEITREVQARHFVGSDIGQGYAGDEDNGETSAWWLFTMLGLYPLQLGDGTYALTSPLFTKATVHLPNGQDIVVNSPDNSDENVYVQSLQVDGRDWDKAWIDHETLADGAVLDFAMGPEPSEWGADPAAAPPSPTTGDEIPEPLTDLLTNPNAVGGVGGAATLVDDDSLTQVDLSADDVVTYTMVNPKAQMDMYTLTSGGDGTGHPSSWVLEGSKNGKKWFELDRREGETFDWERQTRPFAVSVSQGPGAYTQFRLRVLEGSSDRIGLAELELFGSETKQLKDDKYLDSWLDQLEAGGDVTHRLDLPDGNSGVALEWTVPESEWLTDDGWLTGRPDAPVDLTVTATATYGTATTTRDYTVRVLPFQEEELTYGAGTDFATTFDGSDSRVTNDVRLVSENIAEYCCGIGGMETRQASVPAGSASGPGGLIYSGEAVGDGASTASSEILPTDGFWVKPGTTLTYAVHPSAASPLSRSVAIDVRFTDGTVLRDLEPSAVVDGTTTTGTPEGLAPHLVGDQWNTVSVGLGDAAAGKQVRSILFTFASTEQNGRFRGWADDVTIEHPASS
jgi:predicted alpha-1,2-mannosidase